MSLFGNSAGTNNPLPKALVRELLSRPTTRSAWASLPAEIKAARRAPPSPLETKLTLIPLFSSKSLESADPGPHSETKES